VAERIRTVGATGSVNLEMMGASIVPDAVAGKPVGKFLLDVSIEVLPDALGEAEVLVTLVYGGSEDNKRFAAERTESPLWKAIPAVGRGRVAYVDIQQFGGNIGIEGLRLGLDDLARQLAR